MTAGDGRHDQHDAASQPAEPLGFERVEVKINESAPPGWSRLGIWARGLCYDQPEVGFVPN
jgi:hypothetical protein